MQFSDLLNVVRIRQPDHNSVEDQMLKAQEIKIDDTQSEYPRHAMHVFATNEETTMWNDKMLKDLKNEMFSYVADDSRKDRLANLANVAFSDTPCETGNLVRDLKVKVGACVMLTNNIDVTDGLTNGAMGTVTNVLKNNIHKKTNKLSAFFLNLTAAKLEKVLLPTVHLSICVIKVYP